MTDAELHKMAEECQGDFPWQADASEESEIILKYLRILRDAVTENLEKRYKSEVDVTVQSPISNEYGNFLVQLPSDDDLENEAAYFHLDHPKMSASQMFFEGARWVRDKLRSHIKTAQPISDEELKEVFIKEFEKANPEADLGLPYFFLKYPKLSGDFEGFKLGVKWAAEKFHGIKNG